MYDKLELGNDITEENLKKLFFLLNIKCITSKIIFAVSLLI